MSDRISKRDLESRMEKLVAEINKHRRLYHVQDQPEISDEAYDSLMRELEDLELAHPDFRSPVSPTTRVGAEPLSTFKKITHEFRQWSFDDVFDFEELQKWEEKILRMLEKKGILEKPTYTCELKIDGLKIILTYEKGKFVRGATRGDGRIGEDVTQNLRTIESIPLILSEPIDIVAIGEAWLSYAELERINALRQKKGEALFANPRNAAAGSIRQLDSRIAAERRLSSFVYDMDKMEREGRSILPSTQEEELLILERLGFQVNQEFKVCGTLREIEQFYLTWTKKRFDIPYGLDGIVIKINEQSLQEALGYTAKSPRFGVAYKFAAEEATSIVEDVQVQIGRTGALTPVAHLRPVRIAGSTVTRATLHNFAEIERLDVRIGDTVIVRKAGDIIPEIVSVVSDLRTGTEKKVAIPTRCPICNHGVKRVSMGGNTRSVALYCLNPECFAMQKERIVHAISKKGFDIPGLGQKIIEQLVNEGLVKDSADIFTLTEGDLVPLERFAEKSARKLAQAIDGAKKVRAEKFLFGLGIRYVGEETAMLLIRALPNLLSREAPSEPGRLRKVMARISPEEWLGLSGIGPTVAEELARWLRDEENADLMERFEKEGVTLVYPEPLRGNLPLKGKRFVLTGELERFTRDEAKAMIQKNGGEVLSAISQKADFLVAGNNAGSKLAKAKKLKVPVLDERGFLRLLDNI